MAEGTLSSLSACKLGDLLFLQADDIMGFALLSLLSFPDFVQVGDISKGYVHLIPVCWQTQLAPWHSIQAAYGRSVIDSST